jgi:coenzyme F420-0:L-glutamate ligase / coenzyme F420-1:gamma-L-glutamate ligase
MSITKAIRQRRSVRKYLPKEVPEALVLEVFEAAGWAPSAHNAQPWRFIVVSDSTVKKRLAESMATCWAEDLARDSKTIQASEREFKTRRFSDAPVLIVACLSMEGMRKFPDEKRQGFERDLAIQSFGAALQNLLLTAYADGLGACWFSAPSFCKATVRKVLKIPETVEPQAIITMGYPDEKLPVTSRKKLAEYCFLDSWGNSFS